MRNSGRHPIHPSAMIAASSSTAPIPVRATRRSERVANHAEASSGARPSSTPGSASETVHANSSFGRLISTSRLPAIASSERWSGLAASSSISPRRGSTSTRSCAPGGSRPAVEFVMLAVRIVLAQQHNVPARQTLSVPHGGIRRAVTALWADRITARHVVWSPRARWGSGGRLLVRCSLWPERREAAVPWCRQVMS